MIRIELPWPSRALWANGRHHWSAKARAVASARSSARITARVSGIASYGLKRPHLRFEFHPPTRRLPDMQNMPATQKAAIDGIADALGMDDRTFLCEWPLEFGDPVRGGRVVVMISEGATTETNNINQEP